MTTTAVVQPSQDSKLPKEAELGDGFFIEHRTAVPLAAFEPFATAWVCTGHARFTFPPIARWQLVELGEEVQEGESDEETHPWLQVQYSLASKLPKTAAIFDNILINHVNNNRLTGWEPFCTGWICTGHTRFQGVAQWQQFELGEVQLGETDDIQGVQNSQTAKLPKKAEIGDGGFIIHENSNPLIGFDTFATYWLCTGRTRFFSIAQWQQLQVGIAQLGE